MNKRVATLIFTFLFPCVLFGQGVDVTFTPEGISSSTRDTELLLSDPTINQGSFYTPPLFNQLKRQISAGGGEGESDEEGMGGFTGFTVGLETEISPHSKSLILPLNYTFRNFTLGVSLPYIYQRKMEYSAASKEASGMGDVAGSFGYSGFIGKLLLNFNVFAKLPTGDDENMVDGYLVPLGTGSTDWMFNLSFMKSFGKVIFSSSFAYKMNGAGDKIAEIVYATDMDGDPGTTDIETIDYNITNGNMFAYTGGFDFLLGANWILGGWVNFLNVGEGSTDEAHSFSWQQDSYSVTGISNQQDMMLLDVVPMISYRLLMTDLTLMVKVPVITEVNENNPRTDRDLTFIFKIGRKL